MNLKQHLTLSICTAAALFGCRCTGADNEIPAPAANIIDYTHPDYLAQLGQVHLNHNSLEQAELLLKRAFAHLPQSVEATRPDAQASAGRQRGFICAQLGALLVRKKQWKEAAEMFEQASQCADSPRERLQCLLQLSEAYAQSKQPEKAEAQLREVLQKCNESTQHGEMAWLRQDAQRRLLQVFNGVPGRLDAAVKEAEDILQKQPQHEATLDLLVEIYTSVRRDSARAAPLLEKLVTLRPKDDNLCYRLASCYLEAHEQDKAIGLWKKMMQTAPAPQARQYAQQIANTLLELNKKDEAIAFTKAHLLKDKTTARELMDAVRILERAGRSAEAEAVLAAAIETATQPSEKVELRLKVAEINARRDFKKAEQQMREILKETKNNRELRARVIRALYRMYEDNNRMAEFPIAE